ncbi:hypothetical protein CPB86DRAFT_863715 [Serendipita vermifera]|nr:hypothetical protein CPB86DRAFT_863715 [Serendipita vermifera]
MSTTIPHTSEACCQIAPVESSYKPIGTKIALGNYTDVYAVGDQSSTTAVIAIFDIFGYYPQTQQGADILAGALGARVLMPDVFFGNPFPLDKFPPKSDEAKKELGAFFSGIANPTTTLPGIINLAKLLRDDGVTKLYIYGLCWGGKIATLTGTHTMNIDGESKPVVDGTAAIHPAMMSVADAAELKVPIAVYASGDEDVEEYKKIADVLANNDFKEKNAYRVYQNMHHGWAGARADLEKEDNHKEFTDVYSRLATFFKNAA